MAREVHVGTTQAFRRYDHDKIEQTAQASRMNTEMASVDHKEDSLEAMLLESVMKTEEYSQLLFRSVSTAYAFEGASPQFQHIISIQAEDKVHANTCEYGAKRDLEKHDDDQIFNYGLNCRLRSMQDRKNSRARPCELMQM